MSYQTLILDLPGSITEAWADALLAAGALSVDVLDADAGTPEEVAQFGEPGMAEFAPGVWPHNTLTALFTDDLDVKASLVSVALMHEWALPPYRIEILAEQDWVRATQAQFDPIKINDRLWIVPTWHDTVDLDAINLRLDPGLAFGTGSHPTTRLMLNWLVETLKPGESLLDYGCGSGILAIAAAKLGAAPITGVDIDPQAVHASEGNAAANAVTATWGLPESLDPAATFDVLIANILTNPLKTLAPTLAGHVRPGGLIALSGILERQANEVIAIYQDWFDIKTWSSAEGWVALAGTRQ